MPGYEVYPVVDAIGGTSPEAHRAGLDRVIQAGGQPISWVSLAVELQRDWGRQDTVQASMAKYWLTDLQCKIVDRCVQLFGGYGYMLEYPIAQMYVDARVQRIYGGANEIMKEIIARSL